MDKSFYINRRQALLDRMKGEKGIILFLGNNESPAQYRDNCYKWRQDSSWLYFFGIDEPGFAATIDLESSEQTIYADDAGIDDIIWSGPVPTVKERALETGIGKTAPADALADALKGRRVHFLPTGRYDNAVRLSQLLGYGVEDFFSEGKKGCPKASLPLVKAVIELRLVKSPEEIILMDKACDLGYRMHTIARKGIIPGRVEQEIVGDMEGLALGEGWGVSFPTILTQHGEIFHFHEHGHPIEPGKLLVIDAGVENNEHYASDFTRTYPTSGKFSGRQRDIYQIVYECNELAFNLTKPGVSYRDVHLAVSSLMLDRLGALGLVCGDTASMVEDGIAGLFMPHGLGHNIGLDVHDMEDLGEDLVGYDQDQKRSSLPGLGSLRMARKLKAGNVISDEPGIYFIPALIGQWKEKGIGKGCINYGKLSEYYGFGGIRLEDDVLVTEDGARRLGSRRLPIEATEVEEAMAEDSLQAKEQK